MARTFTVIPKNLSLFFQKDDSGPPTAPVIDDPSIDIDKKTKENYIKHLNQITDEVNKIYISRTYPKQSLEYGNNFQAISAQDTEQFQYAPALDASVAPSYNVTNWFPKEFSTPDPIGVYNKDGNISRRAFAVQQYMTRVTFGDNPPPTEPIDKALLNSTGYNEANKFIPQNVEAINNNPVNGPDYKRTLGSTGYQQKLGVFRTSTHIGQQDNETPKNTKLTIEDMQKVGLNLLFDSVSEVDYTIESETDFTAAEGLMTVPSRSRIGKKTSLSRFTAANTLKKITDNQYNKSAVTNFYDNTNDIQTNGSFYSPYNQFDSLVSLGQIALAIAMILALVALLDLVVFFIPNPNKTRSEERGDEEFTREFRGNNPMYLGVSKVQGNSGGYYPDNSLSGLDILTQTLGINGLFAPNYHSFDDCLQVGIVEFFGFTFGNQGRNVSNASTTALRILLESGRITTIIREVLRSGVAVIEGGIADFAGGFSISSFGKLVRKIRDLKIVKFIDVLQQIGDKVLFEKDLVIENVYNFSGSSPSYVDSLTDNYRGNYIAKSRLSNGTMAWGVTTSGILTLPIAGMLNTSGLTGALGREINDIYGHSANSPGAWWRGNGSQLDQTFNLFNASKDGRIPSDVVSHFEEKLEADYMPFYIHDLRTNEILPFHAFLEDVGEDFNVEYSSVEGYGRMDKVHIYKSTTRNVNVTFTMVATNDEDHAVMWYKINKLATVIYPQWTQGRKIEIGNLKFIQPFSQIPGATPVIRLRLGDLWKSNYSKMAVARLFGATTLSDYKVEVPPPVRPTAPAPNTVSVPTTAPATAPTTAPATAPATAQQTTHRHVRARNYNNLVVNDFVVIKYNYRPTNRAFDFYTENGTLINPGPNIRFKAKVVSVREAIFRRFPSSNREAVYTFEIKTVHEPRTENDRLGAGIKVIKAPVRNYPGGIPRGTDERGIPLPSEGPNPRIIFERSDLETELDLARTNRLLFQASVNQQIRIEQRARASATPTGAQPTTPTGAQPTTTPQTQEITTLSNQSGGQVTAQAENNTQTTPPASSTPDMTSGIVTMTTADFYHEDKNPFIKSFKSSGGRGLAGVVTSFKIDLKGKDATWGIDGSQGLRAPVMVNISLTMAVIHDIVPGLDANGIMNAPIWPVGRHNNEFMNQGEERLQQTEDPQIGYDSGRYYFNRNFIRRR